MRVCVCVCMGYYKDFTNFLFCLGFPACTESNRHTRSILPRVSHHQNSKCQWWETSIWVSMPTSKWGHRRMMRSNFSHLSQLIKNIEPLSSYFLQNCSTISIINGKYENILKSNVRSDQLGNTTESFCCVSFEKSLCCLLFQRFYKAVMVLLKNNNIN